MSVKSNKSDISITNSQSQKTVVGRAELKLAEAVDAFNFDFSDKIVLDIGSSTGGFTEFALKNGAKNVIAIEKGTNQMKKPLRFDPRINLYEKTDFLTLKRGMITVPDILLADVSFLSLTKILTVAKKQVIASKTDLLVMLKPQFEAKKNQLHRGVVKNETVRRAIIKNFENWLRFNGFLIIKKHDNKLKGKSGNRERFYWLKYL